MEPRRSFKKPTEISKSSTKLLAILPAKFERVGFIAGSEAKVPMRLLDWKEPYSVNPWIETIDVINFCATFSCL